MAIPPMDEKRGCLAGKNRIVIASLAMASRGNLFNTRF